VVISTHSKQGSIMAIAAFKPKPLSDCLSDTQPLPIKNALGLIEDSALQPVAEKLAAGQRLDRADGLALMTSRDLLGLGALANAVRQAKNGRQAYYVVNRHLNYSNVCVNRCAFCAFWRRPAAEDAYTFTIEETTALAAEEPALDIREFHIVGSCHPDLPFSYYLEMLKSAKAVRPQAALKAFTPVEIDHMARLEGMPTRRVLELLKEAGLEAMPGGGAEIFAPKPRAKLCPRKISGERWLEVCAEAHELGIPTNATMLYGHIETPEDRVDHLLALRGQQDLTGGFNAFIPLAFHSKNTVLEELEPTTALDDLRVIAASRLILDNFPHIKAYWVMLGEKLAQVALHFGADDLDGTIIKENITHSAGATSSLGLSEERLRGMIQAAGYIPVRRDCFYNSLEA
jgi:aminodeoxyfutalosine synthase